MHERRQESLTAISWRSRRRPVIAPAVGRKEKELLAIQAERSEARRSQVSSGDRSAKIRTYNWPQGRVTDHRLEGDEKNHALEKVMNGDLDDILKALRTAENADRLANM